MFCFMMFCWIELIVLRLLTLKIWWLFSIFNHLFKMSKVLSSANAVFGLASQVGDLCIEAVSRPSATCKMCVLLKVYEYEMLKICFNCFVSHLSKTQVKEELCFDQLFKFTISWSCIKKSIWIRLVWTHRHIIIGFEVAFWFITVSFKTGLRYIWYGFAMYINFLCYLVQSKNWLDDILASHLFQTGQEQGRAGVITVIIAYVFPVL